MRKKRTLAAGAAAAALAGLCFTAGGTLAAGGGSQQDPLVTLSYLTQTAVPSILEQVDEQTALHQQELTLALETAIQDYLSQAGISEGEETAASYHVVTLSGGQRLDMEAGCEAILRIGASVCVSPYSPGLIDTTTGSTLDDGEELETNHLYMATLPGRSIQAASNTVKVLVRGNYTIV